MALGLFLPFILQMITSGILRVLSVFVIPKSTTYQTICMYMTSRRFPFYHCKPTWRTISIYSRTLVKDHLGQETTLLSRPLFTSPVQFFLYNLIKCHLGIKTSGQFAISGLRSSGGLAVVSPTNCLGIQTTLLLRPLLLTPKGGLYIKVRLYIRSVFLSLGKRMEKHGKRPARNFRVLEVNISPTLQGFVLLWFLNP